MLYYKFMKDNKGELSQLWIAAQAPNKVSKRVILDLSVPDVAKHIADSDETLALRMRALLMLGLAHIVQKRAQFLVADCLRIQSAIGEVMSLTTNDLPKDSMLANDQQITLSSHTAPNTTLDVDISVEQGELVDRWIRANFDEDQIGNESSSGSLSLSAARAPSQMDMETDMLKQYTQASFLDSLLPEYENPPLLSQQMEIEEARHDDSANLLPQLDASMNDDMGMDIELDPLPDDASGIATAGSQLLLHPMERKPAQRGQRKRAIVPLDKSLELPLSGIIATRSELNKMLEQSRAKRLKLNTGKILLVNNENDSSYAGYGDALQMILNSQLLSGKETRELEIPAASEDNGMDMFDAMSDHGNDETLLDLPEPQLDETVIEETAPVVPEEKSYVSMSKEEEEMEYGLFVEDVRKQIEENLVENGNREISWKQYTHGASRHKASRKFFNLLVAVNKRELRANQLSSSDDIIVSV